MQERESSWAESPEPHIRCAVVIGRSHRAQTWVLGRIANSELAGLGIPETPESPDRLISLALALIRLRLRALAQQATVVLGIRRRAVKILWAQTDNRLFRPWVCRP